MTNVNDVEVLLIEDNQADIDLTLRALKQNNLTNKVYTIDDGAKALDFLLARGEYEDRNPLNKPKLILLDLKLPKVDGIEILKTLKEHSDMNTIPVVILTSSKESPDIERSYKLGANSYIVKPIDFDSFIKVISELGLYWLILNEPPQTL